MDHRERKREHAFIPLVGDRLPLSRTNAHFCAVRVVSYVPSHFGSQKRAEGFSTAIFLLQCRLFFWNGRQKWTWNKEQGRTIWKRIRPKSRKRHERSFHQKFRTSFRQGIENQDALLIEDNVEVQQTELNVQAFLHFLNKCHPCWDQFTR